MSIGSNAVKVTAKTALKGKWLNALICSSVLIFCMIINSYLSSLISVFAGTAFSEFFYVLLTVFVFFPLFLGVLKFFWRMIFGCDDRPVSIFYYYSAKELYIKAIKFAFALIIKLLPFAVIIFLPAFFVWLLSQSYFFEFFDIAIPLWSRNLQYAILFTRTLSTVILIFYALRYYVSPVLFVVDEEIDVWEALHMSSVISKRSTLDFIYLFFSFSGWILISFFALPLFFTVPYIITSYVVHIRFSITEYNNHIEKSIQDKYPSFTVGV